jgi:myo-inositol-1(or 4)-monophosphatase
MSPWLELCREAVVDLRRVLAELPTRREREPVLGRGLGGDDTTAIDGAAERAVVERLQGLHERGVDFTLVSEELGERVFGKPGRWWVVLDPIDGSVNAKRDIPFFSLSLAVADGPRMRDVLFGFVYDFGSGEEWTAVRGQGAHLDGIRLGDVRPKEPIEILSLEATRLPSVADNAPALVGVAERLRIMGSLALSLCHLAAGRVDGVCTLKTARAVDIAAAQLLIGECGAAIELCDGPPLADAPLDVEGRSQIVAGASPEVCAALAAALRGSV